MEALLVLVLAGLVFTPAGGRTVSKCEVRRQLMQAIAGLSEEAKQAGLTDHNFVAKIVCHAEFASDFNSSTVTELACGSGSRPGRDKRAVSYLDLLGAASQDGRLNAVQSSGQDGGNRRNSVDVKPDCEGGEESWTLYGLFQLGSRLACSDGATASPNICGLDCSNLLDDNILDDVHCLLTVFRNLVENGFGSVHWKALRGSIRFILQEECRDKLASEYFAECS